jgi:hypothetical protein
MRPVAKLAQRHSFQMCGVSPPIAPVAGRERNNKPDHLTTHGNRSGSTSLTVAGTPDEEFQGRANSCGSGSGPFGACALPDVFELWWPSVFTSVFAITKVFDTGKAPQ